MFLDMAEGWEAAARQLEQSAERVADSRDMLRRIGTRSDRAATLPNPPDRSGLGACLSNRKSQNRGE